MRKAIKKNRNTLLMLLAGIMLFIFSGFTILLSQDWLDQELRFTRHVPTIDDDFAENRVRTVENVTETSRTKLVEQLQRDSSNPTGLAEPPSTMDINAETFRTILVLELYNRGKQNVLDAIRALDGREDVLVVEPDFELKIDAVPNPRPNAVNLSRGAACHTQFVVVISNRQM